MNSHLHSWLTNAFKLAKISVLDDRGHGDDSDLLNLGKFIFELPELNSPEELIKTFKSTMKLDISWTDSIAVVEAFLVYAVSEQCPHKSIFVENIMLMDQKTQESLMIVIQNNSEEAQYIDRVDSSLDLYDICKHCNAKDQQLQSLTQELRDKEQAEQRTNELIYSLQKELHEADSTKMSSLSEQYDAVISLKNEIRVLNNRLAEAEAALSEKDSAATQLILRLDAADRNDQEQTLRLSRMTEQLSALQDQVDVLQPKADKLDKTEAQVAKMRERLEESSQSRAKLQEEATCHNDTYSKLVHCEEQLEAFRATRSQMTDYKSQAAASAALVEQLMGKLSEKNEELARLTVQNEQWQQLQQQTQPVKPETADARLLATSSDDWAAKAELLELREEKSRLVARNKAMDGDLQEARTRIGHLLQEIAELSSKSAVSERKYLESHAALEESSSLAAELAEKLRSLELQCASDARSGSVSSTGEQSLVESEADLRVSIRHEMMEKVRGYLTDLGDENKRLQTELDLAHADISNNRADMATLQARHNDQVAALATERDRLASKQLETAAQMEVLAQQLAIYRRNSSADSEELQRLSHAVTDLKAQLADSNLEVSRLLLDNIALVSRVNSAPPPPPAATQSMYNMGSNGQSNGLYGIAASANNEFDSVSSLSRSSSINRHNSGQHQLFQSPARNGVDGSYLTPSRSLMQHSQLNQMYDESSEDEEDSHSVNTFGTRSVTNLTVEKVKFAPKKDPDQEALEHGLLLSAQESLFGISMYDALTAADEPVISEYLIQGFSREEAILLIFEDKYGKVRGIGHATSQDATPTVPQVLRHGH